MLNKFDLSNNANKFMRRYFRKIDGLMLDLMTGKIGLQTKDGILSLDLSDPATPQLNVDLLEMFSRAIPAFAMQTPAEQVQPGDIIVGDRDILGWVTEVSESGKSFKLHNKNGQNTNYTPPKVAIMGHTGPLVVKNLFGGNDGGTLAGLQSSLLPLLMMGGDIDFDSIVPLMMLTSMSGQSATGGMGSMMQMVMMQKMLGGGKGKLDLDSMLPFMMMSGAFSTPAVAGTPGAAPAAGLFGGMNPLMAMLMFKDDDKTGEVTGVEGTVTKLAPPLIPSLKRI